MNDISAIQDKFGEYLFNYIKSKTSSIEDAQDIYQDVIYKILIKSDQIKKSNSIKSWLFTVAKNEIIDFHRAKKNHWQTESLQLNNEEMDKSDQTYMALEGCLANFVEALPEEDQYLIRKSEFEGKTQKELSESLGLNYITVRSKVQRGRNKLKQMITQACKIEKDKMGRLSSCSPNPLKKGCGEKKSTCN